MDALKKHSSDMVANNLMSAHPTHPGAILKDEIACRGISQRTLAKQMGLTYSVLNEILNCHRPLTEKTALLFEAILGVNAEPLLGLQMEFNIRKLSDDSTFAKRLTRIRNIAAVL